MRHVNVVAHNTQIELGKVRLVTSWHTYSGGRFRQISLCLYLMASTWILLYLLI